MRRRTFLTALSLGGFSLLTGCAPGSESGGGGATSGPAASEVETDAAKLGKVKLTVWDQEVRGSQNSAIVALIKEFEKKYPNITVDRVSQSFEDLRKQTSLALSGNDVPDVLQVNNARADMGEFVSAGQLVDLSGYSEAYGWAKRFPETILAKSTYSADGVTFGEGSLWGVPQTGEVVGFFYSAKKLKALGVKPPKTWDDVDAVVKAALGKKEQPFALGNLEGYPATHVFGPLQANYVPAEEITTLLMGNAGAKWTTAANTKAMAKLAEWAKAKAFGSAPNGLDYDAAWAAFTKGKGVMLVGGNWLGVDMAKTMGDDLHFMAPPSGLGGDLATTGGPGLPYAIAAKSKNHDAAAAYIDFITSEDAMKLIAENGGLPVVGAADLAPKSGINAEIYAAFDKVSTEGTLLPYPGYATPTFADTIADAVQGVIGGQLSPKSALEKLQKDYAEFTKKA